MKLLRTFGVLSVAAAAVVFAACGGDDDDDSGAATPGASSAATLRVAQDEKLGAILVNADGLTLYTFTQDSAGKSTCTGACAETWPPVVAEANVGALEGAKGEFSLITRDDGKKQVAFNGRPLYRFAADKKAGDTTGQGVGGVWFAAKAEGTAPAPAGSPSSGGGDPYGY